MMRTCEIETTIINPVSAEGGEKCFKKTMKKTSFTTLVSTHPHAQATADLCAFIISLSNTLAPRCFQLLGIPAWFIREYGDEFDQQVGLSYEGGNLRWKIGVNISTINNKPHFAFQRGWKEFAHFHGIEQGERIKFTLAAKSHFVVEYAGNENYYESEE